MYSHVFPPQWIKGTCNNLFHPPLFCGVDENWNWGQGTLWLEKVGGKGIWEWGIFCSRWMKRTPRTPC